MTSLCHFLQDAAVYSAKMLSNVLNWPTFVECEVDFVCGWSADEGSSDPENYEDVHVLHVNWELSFWNIKYLKFLIFNEATICTDNVLYD